MTANPPVPVSERAWHPAPPPLRNLVAGYSGWRDAGLQPARHRGLPSPFLTLIFTLHDRLTLARAPDPAQPPGSFDSLVGGLHTAPALITHEGSQSGIQLAVTPLGARALLRMPAAEIAGLTITAEDVLGHFARVVRDRLAAAGTWTERFAILDEVLLTRTKVPADTAGSTSEVRYAWGQLLRSHGTMPVASLAAHTGWSERHLRDRFRAEIGLAPKAAARVIRFTTARQVLARRVAAGRRPALAEVAARCGYFDQAHLDREFGVLAGCAPTVWLAEEYRNLGRSGGRAD